MDASTSSTITIYRKTAKGFAEIETRANRLPLKQRSVLIMVDGRVPDRDLRKVVGDAADAALKDLMAGGFIEVVSSSGAETRPAAKSLAPAAPVATPAPASTPTATAVLGSPPPAAPPSLAEIPALRREVVRQLTDLLGPMAEGLSMKIETARSWTELRPLLIIGAQMLANTRGRVAAEAFAQRFIVV